jgi:hypothetical protein
MRISGCCAAVLASVVIGQALPALARSINNAPRNTGPCGTLEAEKGVLEASDGVPLRLPRPCAATMRPSPGIGWTFTAAAGWVIRDGARPGDYEVVRRP